MDNIIQPTPNEITIYSTVNIDKKLMDLRLGNYGLTFGNVKDVCRQYGIKYEILPRGVKFTAPRQRLQLFAEKLHFAKVKYSKKPL